MLASALLLSDGNCEQIDRKCPIEPEKNAHSKYYADHQGERFYFCCEECIDEFNRNPTNYISNTQEVTTVDEDNELSLDLQELFDNVWNFSVTIAGLVIGAFALLTSLFLHYSARKLAPKSRFTRYSGMMISRKATPYWIALLLGAEALASHLSHHHTKESISDSTLEHKIHYTTFVEYGDPPLPSRPTISPRVRGEFYRGNDERSAELFNGGNYRTATFEIDLCDRNGTSISHGDKVSFNDLFFRVNIIRAAGTPDYFWRPGRMKNIYVTHDPGKFHWREDSPRDLIRVVETNPMQEWSFRYPIGAFTNENNPTSTSGTFYICEKRFNDSESLIGGRFHCAFSFELHQQSNHLTEKSDLWMGALYRKRSLRIWEIPESQWLGTIPIPEIEDGKSSTDRTLLGIHDHEHDKN